MKNEKSKSFKHTLRVLCVLVLICSLALGAFMFWLSVPYANKYVKGAQADALPASTMPQVADYLKTGNRIHFLNTGSSDAILLETCFNDGSAFALVDCGEDTDYPADKSNLELEGYENYVIDYIKRVAARSDGTVYLDFVVGTHAHSDHIGGFDSLFADSDIEVGKVYLKKYYHNDKNKTELSWDNEEVYNQMIDVANARGFELVQSLPTEPFQFYGMTITLFNTEYRQAWGGGENDQSLGILVEVNGKRAFLAGDINNWSGTERELSAQVGKVDLVKAGHHGHFGSGSVYFAARLKPEYLVVTANKVRLLTLSNYAIFARSKIYCSGLQGGVVANLDGEDIEFYSIGDFDTGEAARAGNTPVVTTKSE